MGIDEETWRTQWSLMADNNDITSAIKERLVSLTISDSAGMESDTLNVILSDHTPGIKLPSTGAELVCTLDGVRMGLYVVDEIMLSSPPPLMKLKAKAAAFDASHGGQSQIQSQKTRSWEEMTLGALVGAIASEHGLKAAVSIALKDKQVGHNDQVNESDIAFLTRIAYRYDATCKPVEGRLVVIPKGKGQSVNGVPLPTVTVTPDQVTHWQVRLGKRGVSSSVIATFRDVKTGEDVEVRIGEGEPVRRLAHIFPDETTARQYAAGEQTSGERGGSKLSLTMPGNSNLKAETQVCLSGFRDGVNGVWPITTARHVLDGRGYTTQVECEGGL